MNPKKALIGIFIGALVVTSLIFINHFLILSRIYYKISYNGDVNDLEKIVEKSELFDYQEYCKYRDEKGNIHNVTNSDYFYHIENEFIANLKTKITNDRERFHMFPFYGHNFVYSLKAINESLLYAMYNNDSIIKLEDSTHSEVFNNLFGYHEGNLISRDEYFYVNFSIIPFTLDLNSTIQINNSILVKMNLDYDYDYGFNGAEDIIVEQYLCFNSNYTIIFISIPKASRIIA